MGPHYPDSPGRQISEGEGTPFIQRSAFQHLNSVAHLSEHTLSPAFPSPLSNSFGSSLFFFFFSFPSPPLQPNPKVDPESSGSWAGKWGDAVKERGI